MLFAQKSVPPHDTCALSITQLFIIKRVVPPTFIIFFYKKRFTIFNRYKNGLHVI
jgi:hypothetical protein